MKKLLIALGIIAALVILLFASGALYVIDETEQAVITRFGKPIGKSIQDAGLHFKKPFIEKAVYFEKRILEWDERPRGNVLTKDKKNIKVDTFGRWRISDPLKFYQSLRSENLALGRITSFVDGATKDVIARMNLIEVVRNSTRPFVVSEFGVEVTDLEILKEIKTGREKIAHMILAQAAPSLKSFGIELEDVAIKRINYVEAVRQTVYKRMISERNRAAEKFRSEGRGEKAKIEGQIEKDLLTIQSVAHREAQQIRGKADKEALRTLSSAYNRDPSFFAFFTTLQSYDKSIKKNSRFIFSTDNDYIKYLKRSNP